MILSEKKGLDLEDKVLLLNTFAEHELVDLGIAQNELFGLTKDPFQNYPARENGFMLALVLNHLNRAGHLPAETAEKILVPAYAFSEATGIELSDLIDLRDDKREIVVEKKVDGENDLYITVSDLHRCTDTGMECADINELVNLYHQTQNRSFKDEILRRLKNLVQIIALNVIKGKPKSVELSHLFTDGLEGASRAIENYDPIKGEHVAFENYAVTRIKGAMFDGLRSRNIRSRARQKTSNAVLRFEEDFIKANQGLKPLREDYARFWEEQGFPKTTFESFYNDEILSCPRALSLDAQKYKSNEEDTEAGMKVGHRVIDNVPHPTSHVVESEAFHKELCAQVEQDIEALPERYRPAFRLYIFGLSTKLAAAVTIGISESRFSQLTQKYFDSDNHFKRTRKYLGVKKVYTLKI